MNNTAELDRAIRGLEDIKGHLLAQQQLTEIALQHLDEIESLLRADRIAMAIDVTANNMPVHAQLS